MSLARFIKWLCRFPAAALWTACRTVSYTHLFESQVNILKDRSGANPLEGMEQVLSRQQLREIIVRVGQVHICLLYTSRCV